MTLTDPAVHIGPTWSVRTVRPWMRLHRRERVCRPVVPPVAVADGAPVTAAWNGGARLRETAIGLVDVLVHAACAAVVLTTAQPAGAPSLVTAAVAAGYGLLWLTLSVPTEAKRRARRRAC